MTDVASRTPRTRHPLALRLQCRKEWTEGQGTLSEIASRHGVPNQTVVAWYRREHWTAARNQWHEKQLSDSGAPSKPSGTPSFPENTHASRAQEYALHIQRLQHKLEVERDAAEIDRLCSAISKLEDVYCRYAGIPAVPRRRPSEEREEGEPGRNGPKSSQSKIPAPRPFAIPLGYVPPQAESEVVAGLKAAQDQTFESWKRSFGHDEAEDDEAGESAPVGNHAPPTAKPSNPVPIKKAVHEKPSPIPPPSNQPAIPPAKRVEYVLTQGPNGTLVPVPKAPPPPPNLPRPKSVWTAGVGRLVVAPA